jgi:hypothetical protein
VVERLRARRLAELDHLVERARAVHEARVRGRWHACRLRRREDEAAALQIAQRLANRVTATSKRCCSSASVGSFPHLAAPGFVGEQARERQ